MTSLLDAFAGDGDDAIPPLAELRLGQDPAVIVLFTDTTEPARLHFVKDEEIRSYVACPGHGCPMCYASFPAKEFFLLPVYDAEAGLVKVLRIPSNRAPYSLGALLVPHLRSATSRDTAVLITRLNYDFRVDTRELAANADRGDSKIQAFVAAREGGLRLDSALTHMTPEELADVPSVAKKLSMFGGWEPPRRTGDTSNSDAPTKEPDES